MTGLLRRCLEPTCQERSTETRCPRHRRDHDRARQARRGDLYKGDHPRRAKETIAAQPWCTYCGSTRDLTADHVIPGDPV